MKFCPVYFHSALTVSLGIISSNLILLALATIAGYFV